MVNEAPMKNQKSSNIVRHGITANLQLIRLKINKHMDETRYVNTSHYSINFEDLNYTMYSGFFF